MPDGFLVMAWMRHVRTIEKVLEWVRLNRAKERPRLRGLDGDAQGGTPQPA